MCGIIGSFNLPGFDVSSRLEQLAHRGPDGSGVLSAGPAVHGHVRLSLVDLTSASDQPFRYGDAVLTFNGEIWNYQEVRAQLQAEGVRFRTAGDTEVLAAVLHRWGVHGLARLEGMFAFAWSKGEMHILVRDRFGEIPLYVHRKGNGFAWSSERKGLGRDCPAAPLPPGCVLDLPNGEVRPWYERPEHPGINDRLISLVRDGVERRLVADAPLCCLISGGLDSSLVLALAKARKPDVVAYTAVLDGESADLRAARRLCDEFEVPLVEVPVPAPTGDALEAAARAIEIDSKAQVEIAALCIPLAHAIASDGFKACLSGEAADELFGGYGNMCIKGASASDIGWREIRVAQLLKMARGNFVRCNKAFMAAGVECRLPFIERRLVEAVIAMTKAECPPGKGALKQAAAGIVPGWVVKRPKDTFQGGAGMSDAAGRVLPDPAAFYRSVVQTAYGPAAIARPPAGRRTARASRRAA
ncbi:asparagine synthetase B family protein [Methylobacterium nodulans]|uniref:asparagine synthase (glutamine-hydrolyzing) n=1 Tax=Methylobacterium nodulans (strain LMG 21967 / CNCM I-2342 / ORS 2060) TaxID=460265 RepID=B8IIU0_METNO|nr:asparagine synthetase B [Methylobacterium nodulans]ACL61735.1 asparagine synthase [Methylobacterium nodulans ORS 2060]